MMTSVALPKVAFSRPPRVSFVYMANCSVIMPNLCTAGQVAGHRLRPTWPQEHSTLPIITHPGPTVIHASCNCLHRQIESAASAGGDHVRHSASCEAVSICWLWFCGALSVNCAAAAHLS
jgi:hypothetical protein